MKESCVCVNDSPFSLDSGNPEIRIRGKADVNLQGGGADGSRSHQAGILQTLECPKMEEATQVPHGVQESQASGGGS